MKDFSYEVMKPIITLSQSGDYTKEVNLIRYNGGEPVLDIRKWDRGADRMLKGITLTREETQALIDALKGVDLNENSQRASA